MIWEDFNSINRVKDYMRNQRIDEEDIEKVEKVAISVYQRIKNATKFITVLLFGKVQSGKTNGEMMTIATLIENGRNRIILLTARDIEIYMQTVKRFCDPKMPVRIITKKEFEQLMDLDDDDDIPVIIISSKDCKVLERLIAVFSVYKTKRNWDICDDEADQASLDTAIRKKIIKESSTTNRLIKELFKVSKAKSYIQVTATPQAILLQLQTSNFKPDYVEIIEPGKGYVGIDKLFSADYKKERFVRLYAEEEINIVDEYNCPLALKHAVCNFFLASTQKIAVKMGESYSFVAHTSGFKNEHKITEKYIKVIMKDIFELCKDITQGNVEIRKIFEDEYQDLKQTYGKEMLSLEVLMGGIRCLRGSYESIIFNSTNTREKRKSDDSRYVCIIGGNCLSRGITIENLITMYYSRSSKTTNVDTTTQHMRLCGYRERDLDIIRIFTTEQIAENIREMAEHDSILTDSLITAMKKHKTIKFQPITLGVGNKQVRPTRTNVIPRESFKYMSGVATFPVYPKYKRQDIEQDTIKLDSILNKSDFPNKCKRIVTIDFLIQLISSIQIERNSGMWDTQFIISLLEYMKQQYGENGYLIVDRDRDIGRKELKNEKMGVKAVLQSKEKKLAHGIYPTIFMYKIKGTAGGEKNWDDFSFWIPIFVMPTFSQQNAETIYYINK